MRRTFLVIIALTLALVAAGCGSSDDASTATSTTTAADATVTSGSSTGPDSTDLGATGTTTTKEPAQGSASEYEKALVKGFTSGQADGGDLVLPSGGAECVAPKWVKIIGVDALHQAGVSPSDFERSGFSFSDIKLSKDQASTMIDAFADCKIDLYSLFIKSLSASLTEDQAACVKRELSEDDAKAFLVSALQGDDSAEAIGPILKVDKTCKLSESGPTASTVAPSGN